MRRAVINRQTTETSIHMRLRFLPLERAFQNFFHQDNPPARRIHLFAECDIGRASRQAETTMDALLDGVDATQ